MEGEELTTDSYDPNGNTTSSGGHSYGYDFENRLISKDGGAVTVVYDGDGNRVAKTADGITTRYLVDELNPTSYLQVVDEVSGGAVQVRYTYGNMLVSETRNASLSSATSFYGYDSHRNIVFLTGSTGAVTDTYDYDAWGILVGSTGTTVNTRLYEGEELDSDLGLFNLRARLYNPNTGRFLTLDPLDKAASDLDSSGLLFGLGEAIHSPHVRATFEMSASNLQLGGNASLLSPLANHRYMYANGDPVTFNDPTGFSGELVSESEFDVNAVALREMAIKTTVAVTKGFVGLAVAITIGEIADAVRKRLGVKYGHIDRFAMCWLNVVQPWLNKAIEDLLPQAESDPLVYQLSILALYQAAEEMLKDCMASGGGGN